MSKLPPNLPDCDPHSRFFPIEWKESYYRRNLKDGGYICPLCGNSFKGTTGFRKLHADHKKPYSKGGLTIWENMVLICGECNLKKSNTWDNTTQEKSDNNAHSPDLRDAR